MEPITTFKSTCSYINGFLFALAVPGYHARNLIRRIIDGLTQYIEYLLCIVENAYGRTVLGDFDGAINRCHFLTLYRET